MDTPLLLTSGYTTQAAPYILPTVVILAVIYIWTYATSSKTIDLPDLGNLKTSFTEDGPQPLREGYKRVGYLYPLSVWNPS